MNELPNINEWFSTKDTELYNVPFETALSVARRDPDVWIAMGDWNGFYISVAPEGSFFVTHRKCFGENGNEITQGIDIQQLNVFALLSNQWTVIHKSKVESTI